MSCNMALEDRTEIRVGENETWRFRVLTRIFRLLHVVQPLDFPGTPTMTKGFLTDLEKRFTSFDAFHICLLSASLAALIYTEVFYIAT